ncbi:MAG: pyruvoyl-dependent arginine decarboxylase [Actinomycetota bacterium]|nr:pyruvoyl-dependent arginine decarboxylase [Actinomycetota bacterium]
MNVAYEALAGDRRTARGPIRTIEVTTGVGSGPTKLAAFDAALRGAGVANFNLVTLSSVIPPGTDVAPVEEGASRSRGEWGDRLYVVMAEMRVDEPGEQAWAGVGWVQEPCSGKGLFAEHEGQSEAVVRHDLEASLASLADARPEIFGPPGYAVEGTVCGDEPACAVAVAVYGAAPWPPPASYYPLNPLS